MFYIGFLGEGFESAEIDDFTDVSGSAAESGAFLLVGAAAVANVVLNFIFIRIFGYVAAGYTTLACYILYSVGHYVVSKRILVAEGIEENLMDAGFLLACSAFLIGVSVICNLLFPYRILRYAILFASAGLVFWKRELLLNVIQADETPVLVNKDGRAAGSKSYMWVYRSGYMNPEQQIILYDYQLTRNASHPREFLKDFSGICVTDGYQVYHTLEKEKEDLTIAGCWVHMRRRFEQALQVIPKGSQKGTVSYIAMKQIQAIYREEGKLKDLTSNERLEQRQAIIKPLVDALFMYLKQNQANVSGSCKLQDAFKYALNQEKYLKVFLTDGDVPIDNNASERAIRGFCVGKKNWQMIDTINGAKTSAMIYSIAETAKANNLKPYDYFEYLLEEIPKHMEDTDRSFLEDLLPWSENLPAHIRK